MPNYKTREEWLLAAVEAVRPLFSAKKHLVPTDCQVSCGFANTGTRSHHIGQCWPKTRSMDERNQIFISPVLYDPVEVLDTLVHELVNAVDDCQHKHGKEFEKIALSLGMIGPMRSAGAGQELKVRLEAIAQTLDPYPHGKLKVVHHRAAGHAHGLSAHPVASKSPCSSVFWPTGPQFALKTRSEWNSSAIGRPSNVYLHSHPLIAASPEFMPPLGQNDFKKTRRQ